MLTGYIGANPGFKAKPTEPAKPSYEQNIKDMQKKREGTLLEQFASTRATLGAAKDETRRQSKNSLDRFAAVSGLGSGASEKAKQEANRNIETGFAQTEGQLGAAEAAAKDQLAAQGQQMEQQQGQFRDTLNFQKNSFAEQMRFQWKEFDENLKTNLINGAIAIKNAGLSDPRAWAKLGSTMGRLVGGDRVNSSMMTQGVDPRQLRTDFMMGRNR